MLATPQPSRNQPTIRMMIQKNLIFRSTTELSPPNTSPTDSAADNADERKAVKQEIKQMIEEMDERFLEELEILGIACLIRSHTSTLIADGEGPLGVFHEHLKLMNIILHCRDLGDEKMSEYGSFAELRHYFRKLTVHMIHKYINQNPDSRVRTIFTHNCVYT
jgi:hypothetical protein